MNYSFLTRWWAASLTLIAYIFSSLFLLIGLTQLAQVASLAASVLLGLAIAIFLLNWARRSMPSAISGSIYVGLYGVLVAIAAVIIFIGGKEEFSRISSSQKQAETSNEAAPAAEILSEDVVRFARTLDLATRMGVDTNSPAPSYRADEGDSIDISLEFKPPRSGSYYLAVQMTDTPFIAERQAQGEYLDVVQEGHSVGQTFQVGKDVSSFGGIRVKLEARSIVSGQPADSPPDAPLTATLYQLTGSGDRKLIDEFELPIDKAGLNDAWKYITFPFDLGTALTSNQTFLVEFTSPSSTIGWALSRVTNGFQGIDDLYKNGELLINGVPPESAPAADLTFDILARSNKTEKPKVLVDDIPLQLVPVQGKENWFTSQPVDISEGVHVLIIQSNNPHISFYRFVFFEEMSVVQDAEADETKDKDVLPTQSPSATPSPGRDQRSIIEDIGGSSDTMGNILELITPTPSPLD